VDNTTPGSEAAVCVEGLTKKFDEFIAVDNISFEVDRGEVFGFLGPNGAGKSTTIRMLCGIIEPTAGTGSVGGYSITSERSAIKQITGYMSQKFSLYDDLTAVENLEFFSGVYGLSGSERRDRIEWALSMSNLRDRRNDLTGNLSGGFKQRLALGAAILHNPSILFLDEPTAGIDPLSRRDFWDLVYELSSSGVTVFVTTHYMDEAEHCDRIALIDDGKLIRLDTPSGLKRSAAMGRIYEISVSDWKSGLDFLRREELKFGKSSIFGSKIHLAYPGRDIDQVRSFLTAKGIPEISIREITPSLEDVFVTVLRPPDESGLAGI
jgi:ABC-2 type transport system ATP-binding protein